MRTFSIALVFLALSASLGSAQQIEGPSSLSAIPGPDGRITLSWAPVSGASGYNIYRAVFQDFPLDERFLIKPSPYISRTSTPTTTRTRWVDGDPLETPASSTSDGTRYYYVVTAIVRGVESKPSPQASAVADRTMPRVENISVSPNPFVPEIHKFVSIKFTLTEPSKVRLRIEDPKTGAVLRTLIDGEVMKAGDNIVFWDGKDSALSPLPPGRYLYSFSGTLDLAGNKIPEDVVGIPAGGVLRISRPIGLSIVDVAPNPFSPDGDNIKDKVLIDYFLDRPVRYVSINIFSPSGEKIAQVMVQRYEYTWNESEKRWVEEPYKGDGIPAGFSFDNYYLKPLNDKNPAKPPYGGAVYERYPKAADYSAKRTEIVDLGIIDRTEIPPGVTEEEWREQWKNWFPFVFTISWDGTGAVGPGNYTFVIQAMSLSGDVSIMRTGEVTIESISIVPSDRSAPMVLETVPSGGEWTMPLLKVSATLSDGVGVGVDLVRSSIRLIGPKGLVPGEQTNDGFGRIEWNISPSLSPFGADDGDYTIVVDPVDLIGNKLPNPVTVNFRYNAKVNDKIPPRLVSVSPPDGAEVLKGISYISVVVRDDLAGPGSGVDLMRTSVVVRGPSGPLYGVRYPLGEDTIRFEFSPPLPADGSADGLYVIEVLPVDKAGNAPDKPYISTFIYHTAPDSQPPMVLGSDPRDGSVLRDLKIIKVYIKDMPDVEWIASGIDPDASTVRLIDPYGKDVQGIKKLEPDGISFSPLYPLQVDGVYSISVLAVDKRGNKGLETRFSFLYDTSPPKLTISVADGSYLKEFPKEISIAISDASGSGVDPASFSLSLLGPKGEIGGTLKVIQTDKKELSISFIPTPLPSDPGKYTLSLSVSDILGNSSKRAVNFILDNVSLISVSSIRPADRARLNISSFPRDASGRPQITVSLDTRGDSFSPTGSYISVIDPDGNPVQGVKAVEPGPTILFSITSPLKEGRYKVVVGGADALGNVAVYEFSFSIDNVSLAKIKGSDPPSGSSTNRQLSKIFVDIETNDDFDPDSILTKDVIAVFRGGRRVLGKQGLEGPSRISFSFEKPLATDGTEDGTYEVRVTLYDMAGNAGGDKVGPDGIPYYAIAFTYDTRPPKVKRVGFLDLDGMEFVAEAGEMISRAIRSVKAEIEDELSGVDIMGSVLEVSGPVPQKRLGNDGLRTLIMEFYPALVSGGRYVVKVTAKDKAGNISPVFEFPFAYLEMSPTILEVSPKEGEVVGRIGPIRVTISVPSKKGISEKGTIATISGPAGKEIKCDLKVIRSVDSKVEVELLPKGEIWPDGEYTVRMIPMDGMGIEGKEWRWTFLLDGTGPEVFSIEPADGSILRSPPSRIRVELSDRSGVDLKSCRIRLLGVDGSVIVDSSGKTYLEEELKGILWKKGGYTIKVESKDIVGNWSASLFRFSFDPYPPEVRSIYPPNKAMINRQVEAVRISFVDRSGQGIDPEGSEVKVERKGDGKEISGKISVEAGDLIFSFDRPLATYGVDDGIYHIFVLLKDKAGGESSFESDFTFDTTPPKVIETSHKDGDSVYVSLTEVWARVSDELSGVDLSQSTISLSGPEGIVGKQSSDGRDKLILSFTSPKTSGVYSLIVSPVDKAGNSSPKPISLDIIFVGPSSLNAESGGVVRNAFGDPVITIPAEALRRDTVIAIAPIKPQIFGGLVSIGEAYEVVLGAGTELRKPAQISLRYSEKDLDIDGDGIPDVDERRLAIYRWDERSGSWVRLTSEVDKKERKVTADVLFLAPKYALIYDQTIPPVGAGRIIASLDCSRIFSPNGDGVEDVAVISYAVARPANRVRITVSTLSGAAIWSYEEKGKIGPGWYKASWDGKDWNGDRVRSGAYVIRLTVWGEDGVVETRSRPVAVIR